jgi:hypothetical protein
MAFCPNCEAEYKPGITVCSDCDMELVAALTPETRIHDIEQGKTVVMQSFKTSAEADMVREVLENNGVRSFVEGGSFAVLPSSFSEEIVLMVDERDMVRAAEIYEAYFNKPDSSNGGEADE